MAAQQQTWPRTGQRHTALNARFRDRPIGGLAAELGGKAANH
jgi:hypothetical protein